MKTEGGSPALAGLRKGTASAAANGRRTPARGGAAAAEVAGAAGAAGLLASLAFPPRTPAGAHAGGGSAPPTATGRREKGASPASLRPSASAATALPEVPATPAQTAGPATARLLSPDGTLRLLLPTRTEPASREDQLIRAAWRQATTRQDAAPAGSRGSATPDLVPQPAPGERGGPPPPAVRAPQAPPAPMAAGDRRPASDRRPGALSTTPSPAGPEGTPLPVPPREAGRADGGASPREAATARGTTPAATESLVHTNPPSQPPAAGNRPGWAGDAPPSAAHMAPAPLETGTPPTTTSAEASPPTGTAAAPAREPSPGPGFPLSTATAATAPRSGAVAPTSPAFKAWSTLLDQVRGRLEALRAAPDGVVRVELQPREWGRLELRLQRQGEGWRLDIQAERAATAGELRNQAQDLYDRLSGTGLRLEELRVLGPAPAVATPDPDGSRAALEADREPGQGADHLGQRGSRESRDGEAPPEGSAEPAREREEFASRLERELDRARVRGRREGEAP